MAAARLLAACASVNAHAKPPNRAPFGLDPHAHGYAEWADPHRSCHPPKETP